MAKEQPRLSTPYTNNVTESRSRYTQGGTSDRYANRVGWWERREIPRRDDDVLYVISPRDQYRPDLIAARVYDNAKLAWIVLQYNNIVDINTELVTGKQIRLPTQRRVALEILSLPTGGNKV